MAPDIKPKAPARGAHSGGKRGMNPLFAGIIIGLVLGVFLALGVAIWLNRAANPFVEKSKPVEAPVKAPTAPLPAKPDAAATDKPRFEFYQLLPGEAAAKKQQDKQSPASGKTAEIPITKDSPKDAAAPSTEAKSAGKDVAKESAPTKSAQEPVYLQAGAFQSATDAENLKAKIAFAGFEAAITPVNVSGKGTLFRVRLGPYKSQDEVNRIKGVLSQNGISAAVVKPE
jgi:cell division protein FtsN